MANYDNQFFQSSMSNLQGSDGDFIKGDSPQSKIIPKTITENGTYDASSDNVDGYSSVTVDVPTGGFSQMAIHAVIDVADSPRNTSLLFINNDSSSVDVSELSAQTILILNPVDELKVLPLTSVGSGYSVTFVPTANCKVYENDTELDLNDIFQSKQTPIGPTTYDPDGIKAHFIRGSYNPYSGVSRKLYDSEHDLEVTIE